MTPQYSLRKRTQKTIWNKLPETPSPCAYDTRIDEGPGKGTLSKNKSVPK